MEGAIGSVVSDKKNAIAIRMDRSSLFLSEAARLFQSGGAFLRRSGSFGNLNFSSQALPDRRARLRSDALSRVLR
jgi:hypothetical protein